MPYSLQDVDAAEALIRELRPDADIWRGYDGMFLTVGDKDCNGLAIFIFRPRRDDLEEREIVSSEEEIRDICFWMGSQWTADEALRMARKFPGGHDINRIQ